MTYFNDIKGRKPLKDQLSKLIEKGRINHGYIFEGPKGSGKKLIADAFSELLFCLNPNKLNTCNMCEGCIGYKEKYILQSDKAITVEDIRTLVADTQLMPFQNKRKIYIIHNADTMTDQAQNAFLKTLEEPPSYAYFILTVTNSEQLIDTILSRTVILYTGVNTRQEVVEYLEEKHPDADMNYIYSAACFAEGCIGEADTLITDEKFKLCRKTAVDYLNGIKTDLMDKDVIEDITIFLEILQSIFRDTIVYKETEETANLINADISDIIKSTAVKCSSISLLNAYNAVVKAAEYIKDNVSANIAVGTMNIELMEELNI
ncbi:MAG TPA: DNA polymerase III subunit delta' C-terminal domain-containing protein [Clostridia bacterium]|jgi:DNA polymerase-3 subunit delta'|nr:MAG: DNA polymerase III subunit tau [Firmicutes bacterium ADurb.Bin146]HOD93141.1 DNA polymerase III subunit delta' C-terminal domain-containing protein [Clostridia bacterium]HQM39062.1 DNA polymerase III subunit delta' C-terminal domain-containing protein [Clostridia bacterium]